MKRRSMALAIVVALMISQSFAGEAQTNGAGANFADGKFESVKDGMVSVLVLATKQVSKPTNKTVRFPNGDTVHSTVFVKKNVGALKTVRLPLDKFTSDHRHWVEANNPQACCLTQRSKKGAVGTLTPASGKFTTVRIVDDHNAIVAYAADDKPAWNFWLRSSLVSQLKENQSYDNLPPVIPKIILRKGDGNNVYDFTRAGNKVAEFRMAGNKTDETVIYRLVEDSH
jgi:hypothetical protein